MRRKKLTYFEDITTFDPPDAEAAWPELRTALRKPEKFEELGLWRLAEDSTALARRRATLVRLIPRTEPRYPDFPDAA